MPAQILDGKAYAETIRAGIAARVAELRAQFGGRVPGLAVVLVGDVAASQVYVRNKENACKAAGMNGSVVRLPSNVDEERLLAAIDELNADPAVHGIIVQLPLPSQIDEARVLERVDPEKDVDGFHPVNLGKLLADKPHFVPCTPSGVHHLILATGVNIRGAHAVIVGRSRIVGKPMAHLLLTKGHGGDATVTVCHSRTRNLDEITRQADILVVALGQPEFIKGDAIKPGAVVIDVGINRRSDGSLCGDVDFASAVDVASWITPVPGGVGPMTVAMLLSNTLLAFTAIEFKRASLA